MASNPKFGKVGYQAEVKPSIELLYLHRLADNNNVVRLKALKRLKNYLRNRSSKIGFTYEDLVIIWKGLYYCMYNADKLLVQEGIADYISDLINAVSTPSQKILFFKAAVDTYVREWNSIDKFRMDKYLMLFTRTLRQCLRFLCQNNWKEEEVKEVVKILESNILDPFDQTNAKPLGLKMHLSDIIMEELAKIGRKYIPDEALIAFIIPFVKVLGVSQQKPLLVKIEESIINELVRQSEPGLENQDDLALGEVEVLNEDEVEPVDLDDEEFEMDPRAGGVDVYIPPLRPDYKKVANAIEIISMIPELTKYNRAVLKYCVEVFQKLSRGIYPLEWLDIFERKTTNAEVNKAISNKREKLFGSGKKNKKKKKLGKFQRVKSKSKLQNVKTSTKTSYKLKKKRENNLKSKLELIGEALPSIVSEITDTDIQKGIEINPTSVGGIKLMSKSMEANKIIKGRKRNPKTLSSPSSAGKQINMSTNVAQTKKVTSTDETEGQAKQISITTNQEPSQNSTKSRKRKRQVGNKEQANQDSEVTQDFNFENALAKGPKLDEVAEVSLKKGFKIDKSQIPLGKGEKILDRDAPKTKKSSSKEGVEKKKKKPTTVMKQEKNNPSLNVGGVKQSSGKKLKRKGKKTQKTDNSDPWKTPMKPGETEIIIPSKKFAKKLKQTSSQRNLVIKSPKVNTKGRTLKINLRKNEEHDFKDYKKALKSSPGIPFSAHKKPRHSVLKSQ